MTDAAEIARLRAEKTELVAALANIVAQLHPRADFHSIGFAVGGMEDDLRVLLAKVTPRSGE